MIGQLIRTGTLLVLAAALVGCAPSGPIGVDQMAPSMQYRGFSLPRPEDPRWRLETTDQSPRNAAFFFDPLSESHTFSALVRHVSLPSEAASAAQFRDFVADQFTLNPDRFEAVNMSFELDNVQGQEAVRFRTKVIDKEPASPIKPLTLTIVGFAVKHPSFDNELIWAEYTERGTDAEVNGDLDKVGQKFLSSIILESRPGRPIQR
ncbi:MAG: hypothetical protein AAFZ58_07455 [Pseudomonadota bacterium]